jgi:hypothetical protein
VSYLSYFVVGYKATNKGVFEFGTCWLILFCLKQNGVFLGVSHCVNDNRVHFSFKMSVIAYVDVHVPGTVLVSSVVKKTTLSSTAQNTTFTVSVACIEPVLIDTQPTFVLLVVLNPSNGMGTSRTIQVAPTIPDAVPGGFYIDNMGNQQPLTKYLSALTVFPFKLAIGDLYFSIPLLSGEFVGGWSLQIA